MLARIMNMFRSDAFVPSTAVFPSIDADRIASELRLPEVGRERGAANQPNPDATELDHVETDIISRIDELRRKGLENYENNRRIYNERLARAGQASKEVDIAAGSAKNDFNALAQIWQSRIVAARERLNESYRWRNRYRQINGLERPAHEFDGWLNVFLLATVLIVFEAGVNSYLFSAGHEFGLLGGITVAAIVSGVNVGVSILFGYMARAVHRREILRKIFGGVMVLLWMAFAVAMNFGVAHLRDGLESGLEWRAAAQAAIPSFLQAPFVLMSIESWLLVCLGGLISVISFRKGWHTDDPYPGYGPIDRRLDAARGRYESELVNALGDLTRRRDEAVTELQDSSDAVRDAITESVDALFGQSSLGAHLQAFLEQCDLKVAHLLAVYRDANLSGRSEPAPASFSKAWRFAPFEPQAVDKARREVAEREALKVNETVQRAIGEIFAQFEDARRMFSITDDVEAGSSKPGRAAPEIRVAEVRQLAEAR